MDTCYHWSKIEGPTGQQHCDKCNLIFNVTEVFAGTITIGKMEAHFSAPNKEKMFSVGTVIKDMLGTKAITISDVYGAQGEYYGDKVVVVTFDVGGAKGMVANIKFNLSNEYEETGKYFEEETPAEDILRDSVVQQLSVVKDDSDSV